MGNILVKFGNDARNSESIIAFIRQFDLDLVSIIKGVTQMLTLNLSEIFMWSWGSDAGNTETLFCIHKNV